jgi:uncharacterized membrane protein
MSDLALRPLSVGEIIDQSLKIYRRNFGTLILITLVANALPTALGVYIVTAGGVQENQVLWFGNVILSLVAGALASAATVFLVSESYLGRTIGAGEAFARAAKYIGPLIVLSFGVGIAVFLGLLALIVGAFVVMSGLMVSTQAMVLEDLGAGAAMSRSWSLTKGFKGKIFGLVVLVGILIALPSIVVGFFTAPSQADLTDLEALRRKLVIATVIQQLVTIVVYPILYSAMTVAYYDLRIRKEGFDLELLESTLQHPTSPARSSSSRELPGPRTFG